MLTAGERFPDVELTDHAGNRRALDVPVGPDRAVQREVGLRETTDTVNHPYVPAVFTLFADLTIRSAYDGSWYGES